MSETGLRSGNSWTGRVPTFAGVAVILATGLLSLPAADSKDAKPATVDFEKQIKPIFSKHCNACHNAKKQESGFRIDAGSLTIKGGDRGAAVVPGKSEQSLLYQALIGKGDVTAMPQDRPRLPKSDIALVKLWIDQGAKFPADEIVAQARRKSNHWAFQPIQRPKVPAVKDAGWVRNSIDAFVLARLEKEGLTHSPDADRVTLIRRVSLDLLGLLPSIEEVQQFVSDKQPGAYERLVDRTLASSHYGERWGRHWLDIARYADSNGFTIDGARSIWKYRDWVIDAINRDLPFDQFTIEQMAGDMLPNPTIDQLVATGFHRNTLINQEGGTSDEQFRVEAVVDRVNTTGAAFLGLTVGCAQCHEHKYDPITQRDFYQLFAFLNNCEDNNDDKGSGPIISVPTKEQSALQKQLTADIAASEKPLHDHDVAFLRGLPNWEKQLAGQAESQAAWTRLEPVEMKAEKGTVLATQDDKSVFVDFSIPPNETFTLVLESNLKSITAVRLEALTHPSLPMNGPGRSANGNFVLSEFELFAAPLPPSAGKTAAKAEAAKPVKIASAVADHSQEGYPVRHAIDGNQKSGWAINVKSGNPNVDREAIFLPAQPIQNQGGTRLTVKLYHNHSEPNYLFGRFRLSVSGTAAELLAVPAAIRKLVAIPADKRTAAQKSQLAAAYKATDKSRKPLEDNVNALKKRLELLNKAIPTTMVLRERKKLRPTYIQLRGDFLRNGARVESGVPAVLPGLPPDVTNPTRLDFARWLVDARNPLTARVTVNRFWQRLFGLGLVETENDFGTQGIPPSNQDLLDWLASEFTRQAWSMKRMHRLLVTSSTYRQSSHVSAKLLERDPRNKLLARQSRVRLDAEVVRDVCLSASGLLSRKMHGPGVYPPQPEGIYVLTQQKKSWPENKDEDRFRRGLYTYFWRSSPYPFLPTFDAPDANTTCTRRSRSNTPLQALTLANDKAFFEFAQGLALRILQTAPNYDEGRMRYAYSICLAREPDDVELSRLSAFLKKQREFYQSSKQAAKLTAPAARPASINVVDAAAWTTVARVLLNLDEFITRE